MLPYSLIRPGRSKKPLVSARFGETGLRTGSICSATIKQWKRW